MDTLTQAALGAAVGQAGFRKLGRRSAAFGAACGLLPDLDAVLGINDPWQGLATHRGLSHSLLVLPFVAVPIGWLGWRLLGQKGKPQTWIHLAFWALITHPILDAFTTYGTQLLAPATQARFAFDTVAIIDLLYTLPLLVAVGYGLRSASNPLRAANWARNALIWGALYLAVQFGWSGLNRQHFDERLSQMGFESVALRTPVPLFFPMLRHGVARDADGRIAVSTLFLGARTPEPIYVLEPLRNSRVDAALTSERGRLWRWFADGMVGVTKNEEDELIFSDHRYGSYVDPRLSGFRAVLAPAVEPAELLFLRPGQGNRRIEPKKEISAALRILSNF